MGIRISLLVVLAFSTITCSSDVAGPSRARDGEAARRLAPAQGDVLYGSSQTGGATQTGKPGILHHGPSFLYIIDPATGVATLVGPIGFESVGGIDFHPGTEVLYGTASRPVTRVPVLITIDTATGAGTEVGPTGIPGDNNITDVSFRPDGTLFAFNAFSPAGPPAGRLYTINTTTGAGTLLGPTGTAGGGNGIAHGTAGAVLYHSNEDNTHTLNQATGAATVIAPVSHTCPVPSGRSVAADQRPSTGAYYAIRFCGFPATSATLITLSYLTGTETVIGATTPDMEAIAWGPAANGLPQCNDEVDNDDDGFVDFPADPGCTSQSDNSESPNPPVDGGPGTCKGLPTSPGVTRFTFSGVTTFIGTEFPDVIGGTNGIDIILGKGEEDLLCGYRGRDTIDGGGGDDEMYGGPQDDFLFGKQGADYLDGEGASDRLDGGHTPVPSSSPDTHPDTCVEDGRSDRLYLCEIVIGGGPQS